MHGKLHRTAVVAYWIYFSLVIYFFIVGINHGDSIIDIFFDALFWLILLELIRRSYNYIFLNKPFFGEKEEK